MSHTSPDYLLKRRTSKKTNYNNEFKEETSKLQDGNESVDNDET